jgi:hypothetical protein
MAVLGDNPMYLLNIIDNTFHQMVGTGVDTMWVQFAVFVGLIAFAALYFKLDRGAITLLAVLSLGVMMRINVIPPLVWYLLMLIIGSVVAYAILTMTKQSDG